MGRCLSIFSGAGGLDVGAVKAGAEVVACVENDPDAAETLRINKKRVGQSLILEEDIADVNFKELRHFGIDTLIGGPPCQPFSKNAYWVENKNRKIGKDPRNLIGQFLRAAKELGPKAFLFENVESILHPTNLPVFNQFIAESEELGYACTAIRANAIDHGVPQKRKRVFVFGVQGARNPIPKPKRTCFANEKPIRNVERENRCGVGKFISGFEGTEYREPGESPEGATYYHELFHVPRGRNYMALSELKNYNGRTFAPGSRFWNFLFKLHPDQPSITIAAQPGPWVGPFHWDNRRLRIPEVAALQTFPRSYKFAGNRRSIRKQIGNAVPCALGKRMVAHLLEYSQ